MASTTLGLGRGLDALIRETGAGKADASVHSLSVADIEPNPGQPRRQFEQKALEELAASIKSQGVLQPILVRPLGEGRPGKYSIVAGERRWRAAQLAGLTEVPVVVRSLTAQETLLAALIENLQREDLNPVEEALGIQTLKDEFGLSQEELAVQLGKSRSAVANSLRLLSLSEAVRDDLSDGKLSAGHARALLSITEDKAREYLRNRILEEHLSVREAEGLAALWKETGHFQTDAPEEQNASPAAPSTEKPARPKPQSARLLELQTRLTESLQVEVKVTGSAGKGRIHLGFNTKAELDALLERLGLSHAGPALEGAAHPKLPASKRSALGGAAHEALPGENRAALQGTERAALGPGASDLSLAPSAEEDGE